ncbi:MAG: spore maturation protein CgeB [Clostridiales bacterium]|nr:spore maturation protein CgeB [Clostridiales bacterium]
MNDFYTNEQKVKVVKCLFIKHVTIADDCIEALKNLGHEVYKYSEDITNIPLLLQTVRDINPDTIFSINFYAFISHLCNQWGIKYISWTVDIPNYQLYSKEIFNDCNFVFIHDNNFVEELKDMGVKNVYHLIQAANVKRLDKIQISQEDINYYQCDVSFVGSLCSHNEYNQVYSYLNDYLKGYLDALIQTQLTFNGYYFIEDIITDEILKSFEQHVNLNIEVDFISKKKILGNFLARKCIEEERKNTLKYLSEYFSVNLYGEQNFSEFTGRYMGVANHLDVMPKVFKISKINLNLTRIMFKSGLPMRVFDVLGSGGFLITNYKSDLDKCFEIGKDLVVFDNMEDLREKVEYYLAHEDERLTIIRNGYEKVKNQHTYEHRFKELLKIVGE